MDPRGKVNPLLPLLFILFMSLRSARGGNILIVPLEGSHWVNMNIMIEALHSQSHSVTVLRTTKSWYIEEGSMHYDTITVPVTEGIDVDFIKPILRKLIALEREQNTVMGFARVQLEMFISMFNIHRLVCKMATDMFKDEALMNVLKDREYDLVLTDPAWGAGIMLAHYLNTPLVYNVRWITSGEGHLAISPSPLSYIPMTGSRLSDRMTFIQRVQNLILYLIWQIQDMLFIHSQYQAVCDEFFEGVRFGDLLRSADLWLMRVDFVFDFPRPTMPNVIYIGGFQCKPAKPLPQHLEEFVQSSGEHGVIIMSLGTFVSELPHDLADQIAAAFARLPQKVIWAYKGDRPATLGNNTLLVDWMPQNDLLGHPKVKVFVAHGGTNGVQEAIYHGVPVLGLPVFFDQHDNLLRLTVRGAAKMLTLDILDNKDNFLKAIQEVLHEPSYRTNMQRLSRLHRDQPIKPLDHAIYWIEFVMRHRGAAHLRTESYKMPWYSYHSVDVILFLITVALLMLIIFAVLMRSCIRLCLKTKVKRD